MKRIAIQGIEGSFHDIAAHLYFEGEQIQLICCSTFEQVFQNMKQDPTAIGMLAIENTIAGSLLHNYELLRDSGTTVVGEHKLHITHSICCLPEDDWDTITEVHSHPVALMQCRQFLAQHPQLKNVEAEDTAGSAQMIAEGQKRGWAAICHAEAAKLYGLKVTDGIRTYLGTVRGIVGYSVSLDYDYDLVDAFSKGQVPIVYDYTPKLPMERATNTSVMTRKYLINLVGNK